VKKLVFILIQITAALLTVQAQDGIRKFGIEANQFIVESGFGTSSELQFYVLDKTGKRLSIGLYYDNKLNKIGGISISTLKMLRNNRKSHMPVFEPYLFYNLIYHKTTITKPVQSDSYFVAAGTYKSMEHHAGIGVRANIAKGFYLKGDIGYGLYLGSIMKPSQPDATLNESYGTHGAGALIKIGIGVSF
jgi:hypothetical protein